MTALPGPTTTEFTDIEAARSAFQQFFAPASFEVPAGTPLLWRSTLAPLGPLVIGTGLVPGGARAVMKEPADRYAFVFSSAGSLRLHHGGHDTSTRAGREAIACSFMQPSRLAIAAGTRNRTLVVGRAAIEEHLRKLTGAELRRTHLFHPRIDLEREAGARLERLVHFILGELARPGGLDGAPLLAKSLSETLLMAILEASPPDPASPSRAPGPLAPGYVRFAEAYMDAHAGQPITIPDVAAAAGVSVRALEVAFRRVRDRSPIDHLKMRRLEHARARLLAPVPGLTVARVARDAGYLSTSYFIQSYRRRFDESPGETLRRGTGWSR